MSRRRLLLFAATACLLLAGPFVVRWAATPAPGVTLENFKRLHCQMPLAEMEAILGRPADHMEGKPICILVYRWTGEEGDVVIEFGRGYRGHFTRGGVPLAYLEMPRRFVSDVRGWLRPVAVSHHLPDR